MTDTDTVLAPHCSTAGIEKGWETIWHHANVCQNGCHRHWSLWFLCDVTTMCRVFETSRKQVSFIRALEVAEIDHARVTAGAALCNTSFGQDKSGIKWTNCHSIGFRSPVRAMPTILFPWHVSRIGSSCLTRRCRPVLLPAGSLRSSSPSGWHEDCFKPKAPPVPGYPLRPSRSTSGFSGLCGSTCWGKTDRNCISHGHSWKLAYLFPFDGATATAMLILRPLPAEKLACGAYRIRLKSPDWKSSLEISHVESEAVWTKNPRRAKNFTLCSCEPSNLVNLVPSKPGLGGF